MLTQHNQEILRKRPDSLFGRVHVRVWDRDYGRVRARVRAFDRSWKLCSRDYASGARTSIMRARDRQVGGTARPA